jgi:hypothetical protein
MTEKVSDSADQVTAIDIVLEPDAGMVERAQAANAGLRKNFPKGYRLDAEHKPHISVMGGYFYSVHLPKIHDAVQKTLGTEQVLSWKMQAVKYYYLPLPPIGLGGIVIQPTAGMIRLQKKLIDALAQYLSPTGSAAAFATTAADPTINEATLHAVGTYFSEHTGEHYNPHVTIGVGTVEYLDALLAGPFAPFTFSAVGVSAYQFGNFGTAAKLLRAFNV